MKEHELFRRRGQDLIATIPVHFADIALGAEIGVPTLEGRTTIRVPPTTQPGQVFRLSGKGLPSSTSKKRGDLHLTVSVEVPVDLSSKQKTSLRAWFNNLSSDQCPQRTNYESAIRERK